MKISKNRLRQIIKEELEKVLSEETDLDNLAGEIVRRNNMSGKGKQAWLNPAIWYRKEEGQNRALVYTNTVEAFSEMLMQAFLHWNTPGQPLVLGLSDKEKIALENLKSTDLATLKSVADEGVLPASPINMLDIYVPKNKTPDAARATRLGKKMVRAARDVVVPSGDPDDDL